MPRPRPRSFSLRGASAAMVGRDGRWGVNGLSAGGPARSSRNGFRGRDAPAEAKGLAPAFGAGVNGLIETECPVEPVEAAAAAAFEPAGSQPARWAFEPRSASSQ